MLTRRPTNANSTYISKFAPPLYSNLNKFKTASGKENNEIINEVMVKHKYAKIKYKAIKKKSPFLLEFRLFEGDSNMTRLINNVLITVNIIHKTANDTEILTTQNYVNNPQHYNKENKENAAFNNFLHSQGFGGGKRLYKTKKRRMGPNKTIKRRH